jgi:2-polyprenyl-3-methyl-5-hydroxy-6-metoxy-1,4-benzoquinol methylase
MKNREFDMERAQGFGDTLVRILNDGAICLMTSIGHRTGLFDAMGDLPASTSGEIAAAAGLDERYVREWLGSMVTGGFVEYDEETGRYLLPPEHAASLTRKSPVDNLAVFAQYMPVLAGVEDRIVECFRRGGGVPYSEYGRFHEVMAEDSGQSIVAGLIDHILPLAPGLRERLEEGIDVLDIGCGRGRAILKLARAFPKSNFTGYDICQEPVQWASEQAEDEGLRNIRFEARDVASLDEEDAFDLITAFDVIHDQARPDRVLAVVERALRSDGTFLMQDICGSSHLHNNMEHPIAPLLYAISTMHCMSVSLAQDGMGLGTMWGREKALEMLADAGFGEVEVRNLEHDIQNNYYITSKSGAPGMQGAV